jgi:hypothetical protein
MRFKIPVAVSLIETFHGKGVASGKEADPSLSVPTAHLKLPTF